MVSLDVMNTINSIETFANQIEDDCSHSYTHISNFEGVFDKVINKGDTVDVTKGVLITCSHGEPIEFKYKILDPSNNEKQEIDTSIIGDWTVIYTTGHNDATATITVKDNDTDKTANLISEYNLSLDEFNENDNDDYNNDYDRVLNNVEIVEKYLDNHNTYNYSVDTTE